MGKAEALREQALDKLYQAKALAEAIGDGDFSDEAERRFQGLMSEFHALDDRAQKAAGGPGGDSFGSVDAALEHFTGRPGGPGHFTPYSTRGGGSGIPTNGIRRPVHDTSWADAVVKYSSQSGFYAALLPSGTVPVSVPLRADAVIEPRQAEFIRQLLPTLPAPNGYYAYMKQTTRTNNAAAVAKGARKPTSIYGLERVQDRTRTVAHLSEPIPRQDLSDASLLGSFIDGELRYGLDLALDAQILAGDGAGENMTGILDPATAIQEQLFDTDVLTTTRKAVTLIQDANLNPTYWAISPTDWEAIDLQSIDQFAANSNQPVATDSMARRLWGIPVLVTTSMPVGTGLLGDFAGSSELYVTDDARVDWSEAVFDPTFDAGAGATDFERNVMRFRAEGRWNVAVTRPIGFVSVELAEGS